MLAGREHLAQLTETGMTLLRLVQLGQQHAQQAVEAVHLAHRLDAWVVLGHPAAIGQAGQAGVAGAGVDLRQAVSHMDQSPELVGGSASGRRRVNCVPWPGMEVTSIWPLWLLVRMK